MRAQRADGGAQAAAHDDGGGAGGDLSENSAVTSAANKAGLVD